MAPALIVLGAFALILGVSTAAIWAALDATTKPKPKGKPRVPHPNLRAELFVETYRSRHDKDGP